jgi:endonuclease I
MSELLEKMSHGRIQLSYSQSRRFLFEHSIDSTGHVWDVYGQREARTPGGSPDVEDVNVEHTWPQSRFHTGWASVGKHRDNDPMKADLHNLYPTDNRLNGLRGNKPFGEVPGCNSGTSCDAAAMFEPPDAHKGNAARAIFYMSVRYGMAVPADMEATLKLWNRADPVDAAETRRNDDIQGIQGNRNPFIDEPSLVDRISDF